MVAGFWRVAAEISPALAAEGPSVEHAAHAILIAALDPCADIAALAHAKVKNHPRL